MSRKMATPETLTVDGVEYSYQYRHGWSVEWYVGIRGVSVSVWLKCGHTRELIVDFPFSTFGPQNPPQKALLPHLKSAIAAALLAGWVPESRGRPFRFGVTEAD